MRCYSLSRSLGASDPHVASSHTDVLSVLAWEEEMAELGQALARLPSDERDALLVSAKAQSYDAGMVDLPNSVVELARQRGWSRQHIYNLRNRAERVMRAQLRHFEEV